MIVPIVPAQAMKSNLKNMKKNMAQHQTKQTSSINKVYESQSKSLTKNSAGTIGVMKYKESMQSNGSNNAVSSYNIRQPHSGNKISS